MDRQRAMKLLTIVLACWSLGGQLGWADDPSDPAAVAFFESKVRPILVERCQSCHGEAKAKGGLRLDSKTGMLTGGDSGPVVVAGKPEESPLVEAIGYAGANQMPPKSKLPAEEIATLTRWVESGAAWPIDGGVGKSTGSGKVKPFNLAERAKHWSWQPVRSLAVPEVQNPNWPIDDVDRFVLAKLEASKLAPAGEADRATLIRRVTFDLTGLPPKPAEVAAFLADPSGTTEAYGRVVDRLLASPHYGERWARHWMDLVRFAETSGHEFDYDIPLAFRYRDYLIRAFNLDIPYNQFVVEQVAGDLIPDPRRDPRTEANESVLGTGFFRLHEGTHSPVDLRDDRATRVDNQIDVLGKSFLGLTIACARCHDHKFDAITTADYYALSGYLNSSRHNLAFVDPPSKNAATVGELAEIRRQIAEILGTATEPPTAPPLGKDEVFDAFDRPTFAPWSVVGDAFGPGPTQRGSIRVEGDKVIALPAGVAHSGGVSDRLRGVIRSRTFTIARDKIQVLASGRGGRINVVIEGFEKIRSPIYGNLVVDVNHGEAWKWLSIDVKQWAGYPAYLEIDDGASVDFTGNNGVTRDGRGFIAVDEIRFGDGPPPPLPPRPELRVLPAAEVAPLVARHHEVEARLGEPTLAQAITDGTGVDARIHVRGNPKSLGDVVPRRFLEVLGGSTAPSVADPDSNPGSGRLDLAHAIARDDNPLTSRVLVNRLWHHHFGRGIVPSVDDFGVMGQPPTHPELLDHLAARFVASGWSIKAIQRAIVTSRTYRMASHPTPEADRLDPTNTLYHRQNLQRLDAESIRDAILAVSGRLDSTLYGPSVPPHLTPFMDGRGRPGRSGPLDGDGRRTLYLNVRRNFLTPMLSAFDFPTPSAPMGRRNVSNVPAQALTLMNDPFILAQAQVWAKRTRAEHPEADPAPAIHAMYLEAFGRPPTVAESTAASAFLNEAKADGSHEPQVWSDLAHVLFNVKEFVILP